MLAHSRGDSVFQMQSSKCRAVWSCMERQGACSSSQKPFVGLLSLVISSSTPLNLSFHWIMTPIFESLENPSPPPFVSPVADFQHPDSSRAVCPLYSPAATRGRRPICCNEFNMFSLSHIVSAQPERAFLRLFH